MTSVDDILAGSPLAGLRRISRRGGDRKVTAVRLAERFAELDDAPADSFVVLSRAASAEITGYRLDMALRWAAINGVAAVAAFAAEEWQPAVTALDIAGPAEIALISIPPDVDLVALARAVYAEIGGGAGQALTRAQHGLEAIQRAEAAGASPEELVRIASRELGTAVILSLRAARVGGEHAGAHRGRARPATSPPRTRAARRVSRPAWSCTPRRPPRRGSSTWPGGPGRRRPGPAASSSPSC